MEDNIRIARELMRIAKMISASNATINGYDECVNYLGEISHNVDMDEYGQNGGSVCALRLNAKSDGLYYNEYVVDDYDVEDALREKWQNQEHIGNEYEFEFNPSACIDDQYVLYSKYPFDTDVFEKWLAEKAKKNIEAGMKVVCDNDTFKLYNLTYGECAEMSDGEKVWKMEIPTWALCYLVNGDTDGLDDEEIEMVDDWCSRNNVEMVDPISDGSTSFSPHPEFGDACDVKECFVHTR